MGKKGTIAPALSYFDAMRMKSGNELICQMQVETFQAWVDSCIARTLMPDEVKRQLVGYDYADFTDRWASMLVLQQHGIQLQVK